MAMAAGIGAVLETASALPAHAFWFGEDQGRYVVTAKRTEPIFERAKAAGVLAAVIGATGGAAISIDGERPLRLADIKQRFEAWLPAYTAGLQ
jgi:phosphoribosylformylglycinamidine synthase